MPLSKADKFFVGRQTTEEYAQQFAADMGYLERMGVNISLGNVGGINWGKLWRGVQKSAGLNGKEEL